MADLLECLLQIKGLRETANRLSALMRRMTSPGDTPAVDGVPPAGAVIARLAEAERVHGRWLRSMLTGDQPALDDAGESPIGEVPCDARVVLEEFLERRRENLEILDRCSATDLARSGVHAGRRHLTVADLVAVMLANDMDAVGKIREALGRQSAR